MNWRMLVPRRQSLINNEPMHLIQRIGLQLKMQDGGWEHYTNSIYNAYVQNSQLKIVVIEPSTYNSTVWSSESLRELTFGVFATKIRLLYGKGLWPAWWLLGRDHQYNLIYPTTGEIDILEMWRGSSMTNYTDQFAHGTFHWNSAS